MLGRKPNDTYYSVGHESRPNSNAPQMNRWHSLHTPAYRLGRRARQERGQAIVEFAVVLPLLLLIIMGILYFGRFMNYSNSETQLAEEGVRWAAVNTNPGAALTTPVTLQAYIASQLPPELQTTDSDVAVAAKVYIYYPQGPPASTNTLGSSVRVCVAATLNYPYLGISGSPVAESATMRIEALDTATVSPVAPAAFTANVPAASTGCPLA
jgi:Flp pilus assembly protein TadG